MKKWIAMIVILALMLALTACGGKESSVTGMIMTVEGTVVTLMETGDLGEGGPMGQNGGMPTPPEGMEGFTMPENMEDYTMPEGMEGYTMPENFAPENFDPEKMEGNPEGQGPQRPPMGQMPDGGEAEITTLDFANAHISVEIQNGKESGSMDDIAPGVMVTVNVDKTGNATYVLVRQPVAPGGGPGPGGANSNATA